jgi:hypothetical protein
VSRREIAADKNGSRFESIVNSAAAGDQIFNVFSDASPAAKLKGGSIFKEGYVGIVYVNQPSQYRCHAFGWRR